MRDYPHLVTLAWQAAIAGHARAAALQGQVTEQRKADASPVSAADLAADDAIRKVLTTADPDAAILSEEASDNHARLTSQRVWIIDPIDGTRAYLDGRDEWAVQVCATEAGQPVAAALACGDGQVALGAPDAGWWLGPIDGQPTQQPPAACMQRDHLIASRRSDNRLESLSTALPDFQVTRCSSVGVKILRLLAGQADCYPHPAWINEWDIAAPVALLMAAGGTATDWSGAPLTFNTPKALCPGMLATTRPDHADMVVRLASVGAVT